MKVPVTVDGAFMLVNCTSHFPRTSHGPNPHSVIGATGGKQLPIGAERHYGDYVSVTAHCLADGFRRSGIPQTYCRVVTYGGKQSSIGTERQCTHSASVAIQNPGHRSPGPRAPKAHGLIVTAAG